MQCRKCLKSFRLHEDLKDHIEDNECVVNENMLSAVFEKQKQYMDMLVDAGKLSKYPLDLTSKEGQLQFKLIAFATIEELMEASFTLKNKQHRVSDDTTFDEKHFREEIIDTFSFLIELCILAGIDHNSLYEGYIEKNAVVKKRFADGY